jgi:hypothetical protein
MENLLSLIPIEHPIFSVILIIAGIFVIRSLFKVTFKLIFFVTIIGFIMVAFFGYSPNEVFNKSKEMATYTNSYVENTIKPAIYNGLKKAHIEKSPDGTFEIIGDNFEIGKTAEGNFIFHIKSLNLSINQDELSKYLSKDEMQRLLQTIQDKNPANEL